MKKLFWSYFFEARRAKFSPDESVEVATSAGATTHQYTTPNGKIKFFMQLRRYGVSPSVALSLAGLASVPEIVPYDALPEIAVGWPNTTRTHKEFFSCIENQLKEKGVDGLSRRVALQACSYNRYSSIIHIPKTEYERLRKLYIQE